MVPEIPVEPGHGTPRFLPVHGVSASPPPGGGDSSGTLEAARSAGPGQTRTEPVAVGLSWLGGPVLTVPTVPPWFCPTSVLNGADQVAPGT